MRIFSVGHGARSLDELVATLQSGGVTAVVDVRSFPGSRRHPQFGREALAASLPARGIEYAWEPRLGGRRKRGPVPSPNPSWQVEAFRNYADHLDSEEFAAGLQALVARAAAQPTAFMCAETHWSQCHRRILSDKLWALRWEVIHLIRPDKREPHHPPPFLRIDGPRLRYDLPVDADGQVRLL
ncbi:MAG TPA: DUF488 domain-containing protein [Polyangia bacterium]|nr:DUF488 domain-containing protein [Polyangia bacterium]